MLEALYPSVCSMPDTSNYAFHQFRRYLFIAIVGHLPALTLSERMCSNLLK